jgi:hypothetical protein
MNSQRYIFVGVSLQGKNNSKEQFVRLIKYSQKYHDISKLVFLIADEIELINQRIFYKGHEQSYRKRVKNIALEIETNILSACPKNLLNSKRLTICRWIDILDNAYWEKFHRLKYLFIKSPSFKHDILQEINKYTYMRSKTVSEYELLYLCDYVLHELPTLIYGITIDGKHFNRMIYPTSKSANLDNISNNVINNIYGDINFPPPYCSIDKYIFS